MKKRTLIKKVTLGICACAVGFITLSTTAFASSIAINETSFPDAAFRAYISSAVDLDGNGVLSEVEIANVSTMNIRARGISDLTGVSYFTSLKTLNCGGNSIEALDLQSNVALTYLNVSNNKLVSLDTSKNTNLRTLMASGNKLTTVDVAFNTELEGLDVSANELTSIDLTKATKLSVCNVSENQLALVKVYNNSNLTSLNVSENQLAVMDVSVNTMLSTLDCSYNKLVSVALPNSVRTLYANNNRLVTLKLNELIDLKDLNVASNSLYALDTSENKALEYFDASNNKLSAFDFTNNSMLLEKNISIRGNVREVYVGDNREVDLLGTAIDSHKMTNVVNASVISGGALKIDGEGELPTQVNYTYDLGNDWKADFSIIPIQTKKLVPSKTDLALYYSKSGEQEAYPLEVYGIGGSTEITWSSADSTVAKVDEKGVVTPISVGTTTVTAAAEGFDTASFLIHIYNQVDQLLVSDVPVQFYTGSAITPSFTVKAGEVILKEGTDYVVDFQNNIQVGTANVLIRGTGTYSFSITKTFRISYNIATMAADLIADQIYTGSAVTPEVLVKNGAYTLVKNVDYTLSYTNNTMLGTGIVTVTGVGNYAGTKIQSFNIVIPQVTGFVRSGNKQKQITLKWDAINGVTGYRVYRYNPTTKKYAYLAQVAGSANNTFTDTTLTAGTEYRYRVRGYVTVNKVKNYGKYSTKLRTATKLKKVTLTAKTGTKKANLSWKRVDGAKGYAIYMKQGTGSFKRIKTITKGTTLKYTKTGLTKGKTYTFKVRAVREVNGVNIYGTYSSLKTIISK